MNKIEHIDTLPKKGNYVYMMCADNYAKIGVTGNPYSRIRQVQTGCPIGIDTVMLFELKSREQSLQIESKLHEALKQYNTYGEWFYTKGTKVGKIFSKASKKIGSKMLRYVDNGARVGTDYYSTINESIYDVLLLPMEGSIEKLTKYKMMLFEDSVKISNGKRNELLEKIDSLIKKRIKFEKSQYELLVKMDDKKVVKYNPKSNCINLDIDGCEYNKDDNMDSSKEVKDNKLTILRSAKNKREYEAKLCNNLVESYPFLEKFIRKIQKYNLNNPHAPVDIEKSVYKKVESVEVTA